MDEGQRLVVSRSDTEEGRRPGSEEYTMAARWWGEGRAVVAEGRGGVAVGDSHERGAGESWSRRGQSSSIPLAEWW